MSDLKFIDTNAGDIADTLLVQVENAVGEPLYPGDERRIYTEALSSLTVLIYENVNDACRQKMLRYARGEVLDALGENREVYRISATPAECKMSFTVDDPYGSNIIIPAGTRVTPDFSRFFATSETAVLQAGSTSVTVNAVAEEGGTSYNGIAAGKINSLANPSEVPLIDGCENLDASHGGGDEEGDDAFRLRIREAESKYSTAGAAGSYRYYALSANSSISDVAVVSETITETYTKTVYDGHVFLGGADLLPETLSVDGTSPESYAYQNELLDITVTGKTSVTVSIQRTMANHVKIVPICIGGTLPDADVLKDVLEACSADTVRPMTDYVSVESPTVEYYDVELTYWVTAQTETEAVQNIEGTGGAVDQYHEWQQGTFRNEINPDQLRKLVLCPHGTDDEIIQGAYRVDLTKPVRKELDATTIAKWSGKAVIKHVVGEGS